MSGNEGSSSRCVCLESRRIEDNNVRNFQKINFILIRKIKFSKILRNSSKVLRLDAFGIEDNDSKFTKFENLNKFNIGKRRSIVLKTSKYAFGIVERRKITKWVLRQNFVKIFAKETCTIESIITRDAIETPRINYRHWEQFPIFKKLILTRFSQSRKKLFSISLGKLSQRDAVETPHYRINLQQFLGLELQASTFLARLESHHWIHGVALSVPIPVSKVARLATLPQ